MAKSDLDIYDRESGKVLTPQERQQKAKDKADAREAAKIKTAQTKAADRERSKGSKLDNAILKSMYDRINNASSDEEAKTHEDRLKKYRKSFKNIKSLFTKDD